MTVCFSLTNLELGGAQVFVVRLANEMATQLQQPVYLYDHWPEIRNKSILTNLSPLVKVLSYSESPAERWVIWKLNAFFKVTGIQSEFRHKVNRKRFQKALLHHKVGVLNSHMSFADFENASLPSNLFKRVITLHGEYELLLNDKAHLKHWQTKIQQALQTANAVIYTADKNLESLKSLCPEIKVPLYKIPVGFSPAMFRLKKINREDLGLKKEDFVVGMISRGIAEKGWESCIRVVQKYNKTTKGNPTQLVLIGDGVYLKELVEQYKDPNIRLIQFGSDFQDYFSYYSLFSLLLFPTYFSGESFPNVVIESLYWSVPVLSVRYAEIPAMLRCDTAAPAGECVSFGDRNKTEEELLSALSKFILEPQTLSVLSKNCEEAFKSFDMANTVSQYKQVLLN